MAAVFPRVYYCCGSCGEDVADHNDLIQTNLTGRDGRAFLFRHAMNARPGEPKDIRLMTGVFSLADVFCSYCNEYLGWKYLYAYEASQKYKQGYHVLETYRITEYATPES